MDGERCANWRVVRKTGERAGISVPRTALLFPPILLTAHHLLLTKDSLPFIDRLPKRKLYNANSQKYPWSLSVFLL